jgi:hypothetical protein
LDLQRIPVKCLSERKVAAGAGFNSGRLTNACPKMGAVAVFAIVVSAALYFRKRSDYHKRLMALATLAVIQPAVARVALDATAFFSAVVLWPDRSHAHRVHRSGHGEESPASPGLARKRFPSYCRSRARGGVGRVVGHCEVTRGGLNLTPPSRSALSRDAANSCLL